MGAKLHGRFGAYEPKTPADKARARREQAKRADQYAAARSFKERHRLCANGCGREAAWYEGGMTLRFGGCCSASCLEAVEARDVPANRD